MELTSRVATINDVPVIAALMKVGTLAVLCLLATPRIASPQQTVTFATDDGGRVCADLYGRGTRGVVLAHGGRFNKESWRVQADTLVAYGFRVLAIDFRGYGCSTGPGKDPPYDKDVLAAVRYLKTHGATTVSVVGGSFGAAASGDASIESKPGEIDRIVFLGAAPNLSAENLKSRALFILARYDSDDAGPRLPAVRAQYEKVARQKELIVLDGTAHAQFLFQTDQSARVMHEIVRFLSSP
ncbi:MAG TPA: alpha/beta hydrolase [Gemmatimonadaceae bacterium]|jgi:alpha/beta superfamily hydrolase